ncbi:MAG: PLxRFG domain-containing protein [Loktanella sp.]|nr:PLxRFG domain-containing protein [Loktanella sp.]
MLEPAMGIGNFFGLMPRPLESKSDLTGIELDRLTGGMAKILYPQANISVKGYQESQTPDDFYDLVIGNWPFARQAPADRRYDSLSPSLHDYFFVKGLDQVRPGGLVVGITSAGTMDKQARSVRMHLAKNAELVAAYRLPSGAFKEYAGTAVVTDIIVLKKRERPIPVVQMSAAEQAWIDTEEVQTPAGQAVRVNKYFADNPAQILGTLNYGSGTRYGRPAMIVDRPDNLAEILEQLPERVPEGVMTEARRGDEPRFVTNNTTDRVGSVIESKGNLYVSRGDVMTPLADVAKYEVKDKAKTAAREDQLKRLVGLRKKYGALIDAERDGLANTEKLRKDLKKAYEEFRAAHGPIVDSDGIAIMSRPAIRDSHVPTLRALENTDGMPAKVMTESTVRAVTRPDKPTLRQAFVLARNENANVDLERVADLAKVSVDKARDDLLESGAIYRTPGDGFEVSDVYLSGNVRRKMREAQDALQRGEDMQASIDALTKVIPEDIPYYQIEAKLGATWVSNDAYQRYLADRLGLAESAIGDLNVRFTGGTWKIRFENKSFNNRAEARTGAGHERVKFDKLFQAAMNNQTLKVKDKDRDGGEVLNEQATNEVNEKATKLREDFSTWLWEDPERRVDMEFAYNEAMNAIAIPQYDGSFMDFPGMALKLGDRPFDLREHQVNAIWRGIANQRGLFAHEVGTGKTFTMGGIAVESRRYGLAKKPMIFAHNANSGTVAAEINEMYPGAKVLYIDNLSPKEIDTQMRRIANDDWDAIVVPHSTIDRFSMREETLNELAQEEIAAMEAEALAAAEEDGAQISLEDMDDKDAMKKVRSPTAKDLVKQRNAIIERIKKQAARSSREGAVPFEDLGVDMIIVDEVHEFKKPPIVTKMQMKGLNTKVSQRSTQLRFLTDYVKKNRAGKGVFTFTGTPITNTLTEIYNQMRYVMDDVMAESGVKEWDAWFNTFAEAGTDVELAADGTYTPVTRLSSFVNVAELRRMAGEFMDIVFADDMPEFEKRKTEDGKTLASDNLTNEDRDALVNGRTENPVGRPYRKTVNDIAEMGPAQSRIMQDLVNRSNRFRNASPKERREIGLRGDPEMPIRVETDAAKASLDVRLFDMRAVDEEQSKANRSVRNVLRHHQEHPMATQAIFMEKGFSDSATKTTRGIDDEKTKERIPQLHLAKDIKQKLMDGGVPEGEIAIVDGSMNKAKRKEIAANMNDGTVRVVIGSTATLGVGVNMQRNLRAMHHLDAPWMPGELTQRNGRGERQGNQWNTVLEYRYITEKLDGRRWQLLTIKDQFIRAFLKADQNTRIIEGDATSDQEGENADELAQTLSDAAGDPRLLMINKLQSDVERLERRERAHTQGTVDAKRRAKRLRDMVEIDRDQLATLKDDAAHAAQLAEAGAFKAEIDGATFKDRKDALEALDEVTDNITADMKTGQVKKLPVSVNGFDLQVMHDPVTGPQYSVTRKGKYPIGKPSIRSIEQTVRNLPQKADTFEQTNITDRLESAARMEDASKQPFAQGETLGQKRKQLKAMQEDLEGNPVPPPAWLRNGAPPDSMVYVDGKQRTVTGHRWDDQGYWVITDAGDVSYDRARDADGVRIFDDVDFAAPIVAEDQSAAPQGRRTDTDATPAPFTRAAAAKLQADLQQELDQIGIGGRVRLRVAKAFKYDGKTLDGYFHEGVIGVGAGSDVGARGVMRHEAIHAMRNRALWGRDYGLFTKDEWQAMVRAARNNKRIRDRIERGYPDLNTPQRSEEMVAEAFREWMDARDTNDASGRAFDKLRRIVEAFINALRRNGANEAAQVFERIRSGEIGGRGPDGPGGRAARGPAQRRRDPVQARRRDDPSSPAGVPMGNHRTWRKKGRELWDDFLTDTAMGGGRMGKANMLALVPGRPLFEELGRNLPSAQVYLKLKDLMDTMRQEYHAKTDDVARDWIRKAGKDTEANGRMMELMHSSTLAGIDPSVEFDPADYSKKANKIRLADYERLRADFEALPQTFQDLFRKVRDDYGEIADEFEKAIIENIQNAQSIAVKRAQRAHDKEVQRITDEGLTGKEKRDALAEAESRLKQAKARTGWAQNARIAEMRQQFESNRLSGVYFPLARFGKYFVAARDAKGKVVSFSRFEKQGKQREEAQRLEAEGFTVDSGVLGATDTDLKTMVDPAFVADMENLMATWDVEPAVMDTLWQKWLETLPDQSIRTSRIHRKGREGFQKDALRAYTHHMFHGSHQLARLKYGLQMEDAIDESYTEAAQSSDSNRATLVVDEMSRRHKWTMNPQVSSASTAVTSLAFVWYLGATPAAAMVNLTQTTIMGIPIMNAAFQNASISEITRQLGRAGHDFVSGRGEASDSSRLTQDEKDALAEAHKRGIITRTQGHELASVAETGVEYSGRREKVMRFFSYLFHKAEVANREVTFLASYRIARAEGGTTEGAVDKAGRVTWKTHFDYQGSSRPRFMQGDWPRVFLIFRQFQVNAIYRLFRDTYQTFEGKTPEERREAKAQLVGITLSMMAHAGITGTWGYGLITMLMALFFPGDDDDIDEWLHDALLLEGNGTGTAAWNYAMGMALKGVPGQISGAALSERIGIPNLWFRGPFYDMDAQDTTQHYINELLGPAASMVFSAGRGLQYLSEGDWWRGSEAMVPKIAKDISKGVRYGMNGVETRNGDPILEDVSPYDSIVQAMGFTPAKLAERYDDMSRMRDKEQAIIRERSNLHGDIAKSVDAGKGLTPALLKRVRAFNKKYPTFPIKGSTIRRSMGARQRWSEGVRGGVNINEKLRPGIEQRARCVLQADFHQVEALQCQILAPLRAPSGI